MGYGCCYQCTNGCNYRLHEECLMASPVANHPFYNRGPFFLQSQNSPNTSFVCNACGMTAKGLRYVRDTPRGSFFLHPCCMNMPGCIQTDDGETLYLNQKLVSCPCQYCERMSPLGGPIGGWAYVSADQQLACHVKCMKQMLYENWRTIAQRPQLQAQWWLAPYGGSSGSSSRTTMGYHNAAAQPQSNGSSGRKRRYSGRLQKFRLNFSLVFTPGIRRAS